MRFHRFASSVAVGDWEGVGTGVGGVVGHPRSGVFSVTRCPVRWDGGLIPVF